VCSQPEYTNRVRFSFRPPRININLPVKIAIDSVALKIRGAQHIVCERILYFGGENTCTSAILQISSNGNKKGRAETPP
jgi:hypothetical protein